LRKVECGCGKKIKVGDRKARRILGRRKNYYESCPNCGAPVNLYLLLEPYAKGLNR